MKRLAILIFSITLLLIMTGFIYVELHSDSIIKDTIPMSTDYNPETDKKSGIYINIDIVKSWEEPNKSVGAEYDGVIYNFTDAELTDWHISFTVPYDSRIDSSWNGIYKL